MSKELPPTIGELEAAGLENMPADILVKASQAAAYSVRGLFEFGDAFMTPSNAEQWIKLYVDHVWAYAGVFAIASTIAQLDIKMRLIGKGGQEDVKEHPALDLLNRPNELQTRYDLMEALVIYLETSGDSYWEVVQKKTTTTIGKQEIIKKQPVELYTIPSYRLRPVPKKPSGHGIDHYVYQQKNRAKKDKFRPDQIVPFHYFHPLKDFEGQGSLMAAIEEIKQDKQMSAWNLDFFLHGVTPEGLISTEQRMTPNEVEKLGEDIREFLGGKGRKVLILSKNLKWQTISVNPKDIDFLKGRAENRQAILAVLGVPPIKVGLLEHAKYDNYSLQLESFARDTIIPKLAKIAGALNNFYLTKFPEHEGMEIYFDTTPLLKEDVDKLTKRFAVQIEFGMITPNEAREQLGYEVDVETEEDPGNKFYIKSSLVEMGLEETEESLEVREDEINQKLEKMQGNFAELLEGYSEQIVDQVYNRLKEEL
ncbi:hypothetical protein LCGC14_0236500 [marine sediment metagenome]|uniref:Phage portal protein n=1 Tax=marine sediment metagenome TaxID=412755 RepID=A0A0F9UQP5_9ZZZZ